MQITFIRLPSYCRGFFRECTWSLLAIRIRLYSSKHYWLVFNLVLCHIFDNKPSDLIRISVAEIYAIDRERGGGVLLELELVYPVRWL